MTKIEDEGWRKNEKQQMQITKADHKQNQDDNCNKFDELTKKAKLCINKKLKAKPVQTVDRANT